MHALFTARLLHSPDIQIAIHIMYLIVATNSRLMMRIASGQITYVIYRPFNPEIILSTVQTSRDYEFEGTI